MTKIWIIVSLLFGYPTPVLQDDGHSNRFKTETACLLALHAMARPQVRRTFKLDCFQIYVATPEPSDAAAGS